MRVDNSPRTLAPRLGAASAVALLAGLAAAAPTPVSALLPATSPIDGACNALCAHAAPHPLFQALENLAAKSDDAPATRLRLLEQIRHSPACYAPDLTPEEYEDLILRTGLLPAGIDPTLRYFTSSTVWFAEAQQGPSGTARRANMTYSFPDDGTSWGLSGFFGGPQPNVLNQMFANIFGAANVDRGREMIRQSLASWSRASGLTYREVADDNTPQSTSTSRSALRGDIRIGGYPFVNGGGVLAYNVFPNQGSDMAFNTNSQSSYASSGANYRFLRNVAAHEHGHGMGYIHSVPCNQVFLMEPSITLAFDMLTVDERRGANRNYGDRFAGNTIPANARDFGDLTDPAPRSVIERDLSTNGQSGPLGSSTDWYRFTIATAQPVSISATPTGGTYTQGAQQSGCSGPTAAVAASQAGNLNIELRQADGVTTIQTAASAGAGQTETLNVANLAPGTYTFRVFDAGPNPAANQVVQLYDLTVRISNATAPPQAVAGLDKRCRAVTNCYFIGDINSRALDAGAVLTASSYAWDLDGDGTFEVLGAPQTARQYVSNGVYDVTLRVTDSNGRAATDTISLTVFGATTTVGTVTPNLAAQGDTIPVTITGTNLKNVTSASMVTVSGSGVTVTGTPVSNAIGTTLTGLSFVLDPGAAVGARNITVSNADGNGTGVGLFTVELGGPDCPADWNGDTVVNSGDISAFLTAWLDSVNNMNLIADFNDDNVVNSGDISSFLTAWLAAVGGDC